MWKRTVSVAVLVAGLSSTVSADGLPDRSSRSAYTAPFNWTGFYLGGHGGYANSTATGPDLSFDQTGGFGGLQMGLNHQFSKLWVIGFEQDVSFADIKGSTRPLGPPGTLTVKVDELGTLRARVGVNLGHVLLYETAGVAWSHVSPSVNQPPDPPAKDSRFITGFTVGGGVEVAASSHLTFKAEYLYLDFPAKDFLSGTNQHSAADAYIHTFRLGANWQFH